MAEPLLNELFGANATQSLTELVIKKSDLAVVGLTPDASNRAESLWVAMFLLAAQKLTQASFDDNIEQGIVITRGYSLIVTRDGDDYKQVNFTVALHKPDTDTAIDPDNY